MLYICIMKREFGKWLMDIAKYMVTALLLSTIFADMDNPVIIYMVVVLSIIVLVIGLYLVSDDKKKTYKKNLKGKKDEYTYCCWLNGTRCYCGTYIF